MALRKRGRDSERGASAVEYGLLLAGIATVISAAVFLFGGQTNDLIDGSCDNIVQQLAGVTC